jgi:DNA topoisomerase-1
MSSKSLVIVESSAKARTISRYLDDQYRIEASVGHIMDLPKKELGVDVDGGFEPKYVVISGKEKILKKLKGLANRSERIFLALDPDREGEAIAWFLVESLDLEEKQVHRVMFYEITREAVRKAMENPGRIDLKKVNAQQARRILDRLVGYKISPILWKTLKPGISAGRVQTVALRLICEREKEIEAFVAEEYWTIHAHLETTEAEGLVAKLVKIRGEDPVVPTEEAAEEIIRNVGEGPFVVSTIERKERKKNPNPPYITSTLQQDASRKLGLSASRTMAIAQSLYEGIDLDKERRAGLITYMRTDSFRLAPSAVGEARSYIREHLGGDYLPEKPRIYKSKRRVQDAHEAIRPTSLLRTPESVKKYLDKYQFQLYELIWKRTIACQMKSAIYDVTSVDIPVGDYLFRASGSVLKFPGYQAVQGIEERSKQDVNGDEVTIPELREGEELSLNEMVKKQHFTQPPPRYSEGSLIKELESRDIGRPSTYASIVATLRNRNYVRMEKKRFIPVDLGKAVNEVLVGSFPEIFEVEFTRHMESELDKVENGDIGWKDVLEEFYIPFSKSLQSGEEKSEGILKSFLNSAGETCDKCGREMDIKWSRNEAFLGCSGYPECRNTKPLFEKETPEVDEKCPKCRSPLQVKNGRYGSFLACTAFPECRFTKKLGEVDEPEEPPREEKCDLCGGEMVLKRGRFGRFLSCSNYPDCKGTQPLTIGVPCPKDDCEGELVERKGKKGKLFYGCSKYPDCKFVSWNMPRGIECPSCQYPYAVVSGTGKSKKLKCLKCGTIFVGDKEISAHRP